MKATIQHKEKTFRVDLSRPLDISIPLSPQGPRAWYVDPMKISPVINAHFAGSVALNGSVNFNNIFFNPHGHGTHTESVGHITREFVSVNQSLQRYFFDALLITIDPILATEDGLITKMGDKLITAKQLAVAIGSHRPEALILRTRPNEESKCHTNYSDTNFPYFESEALKLLSDFGVEHLLVDLPSVDRESDGGALMAHHAFWNHPVATRQHCTITEFIFVSDLIADGEYLLNLQTAPFENDATPSRPVLYQIERS